MFFGEVLSSGDKRVVLSFKILTLFMKNAEIHILMRLVVV